jgi:hypothetical protein
VSEAAEESIVDRVRAATVYSPELVQRTQQRRSVGDGAGDQTMTDPVAPTRSTGEPSRDSEEQVDGVAVNVRSSPARLTPEEALRGLHDTVAQLLLCIPTRFPYVELRKKLEFFNSGVESEAESLNGSAPAADPESAHTRALSELRNQDHERVD